MGGAGKKEGIGHWSEKILIRMNTKGHSLLWGRGGGMMKMSRGTGSVLKATDIPHSFESEWKGWGGGRGENSVTGLADI